MKIRLISIGKTEDDYIRLGTDRFLKQIRFYHPFEEIRVKGVKASREKDIPQALDREAASIQKHIHSRDRVCLLDREGEALNSESFAAFLETRLAAQSRSLTFVIGSAAGVSRSIQARAEESLSLSAMTLTHELARLLLLEQIYRGFTILRGKRYHR